MNLLWMAMPPTEDPGVTDRGAYPSCGAANAAYMRMVDPIFSDASECRYALAFDREHGNMRHARVAQMED